MSLLEIVVIAISLAMDAFAVSVAAGTQGYAREARPVFRLAFHLGLFQFLMPVIGWYLGSRMDRWINDFDHWVAFGLLALVGTRTIYAALQPEDTPSQDLDPTRKWSLLMICVATSIDALAVGFSLAMIRVNIWYPSALIGVITSSLSLAGLRLGHWVGNRLGPRMEIVAGVILWIIGLRILWQHG